MNNLHDGGVDNLIGKGMTTMIRDTNNVANIFNRIRRKMTINILVVNLLPKMEPKEDTDVRGITI